jgi:flagellar hook-associated protein 2
MAAITFSGLASGIDSSSLIKSLLDQERKVKIGPLSSQIENLSSRNESYSKLSELLNVVKDQASKLRLLNGGALSKQASSSDESVLTASASNSTSGSSYSLSVSQIAKNATLSLSSAAGSYSSSSDKISSGSSFSDTVDIVIGDSLDPEDSILVSVNENTSLSDFVVDFNSQTSAATAALVNIGSSSSPDYQIVISSKKTGEQDGQISFTTGATLLSRLALDQNQLSQAKNSIISIDGIATNIERSSNSINDVPEGIILNIRETGTANLSIDVNQGESTKVVKDLISKINETISYIKENDLVTQSENGGEIINTFGPLAQTSIDEGFLSGLRSSLVSNSYQNRLVNTLADLGIKTLRDGTLELDEETFAEAITSDSDSVSGLLESLAEELSATDGLIAQYTQFNGIIDLAESSNSQLIDSLNKRISETETRLSRYEESLLKRFSALEVLTGKLQSAQAALSTLGA